MPCDGWLPLAMDAPILASACWMVFGWRRQQLFQQVGAAGDAEFLGHHPQRILRSHKMDARHAFVRLQRAQQLAPKDRPRGAGNRDGEFDSFHANS